MTERPCPQEGGELGGRLREAWEWAAVVEQVAGFGWTRLDVRCATRERGGGDEAREASHGSRESGSQMDLVKEEEGALGEMNAALAMARKREKASLRIANGRKNARFVRRSWQGSNPRRPAPEEQVKCN